MTQVIQASELTGGMKQLHKSLRAIYGLIASITVITGEWKHGKTDFGLKLLEWLKDFGFIYESASNIYTEGSYNIKYLNDMMSVKAWAFRNRHRKAYVYDEAIASTPSRRAMSKLNTEWLKFIPQLSKAKMHLIVITQETEFTEGSFLHETFIRGLWKKIAFPKGHPQYRKMVKLYSTLLPEIPVFRSVPRCSTKFDPFKTATFTLQPENPNASLPDNVAIAIDYASPMSSTEILKKYTFIKTRKQVMDRVRSGINAMKSCFFVHNQAEGKSPEIFETNYSFTPETITSEEEAQNKALLEEKGLS